MTRKYRYKVTGLVRFSVDDVVCRSPKEAKEWVTKTIDDDLECASNTGTLEILELSTENLGRCDPDRFYYGDGEC